MDKIYLGNGEQGSGDSGFEGGNKINNNYIALVEAMLGVTIWSNSTSENLDLTTLNTTDKSSIKAAINELLERTKLIDDSLISSIFKTWSVDKLVATLANYLQLSGGTLTGGLNYLNTNNKNYWALKIISKTSINGDNNGNSSGFFVDDNHNIDLILRSGVSENIRVMLNANGSSYFNGGNVGIGTDDPKSKLDVEGGVAIGATYSGTNAAPANGLLVEGNVGIGTNNPQTKLHLVGDILIQSSESEEIKWYSDDNELFVLRKNNDGGGQIFLYSDSDEKLVLSGKGNSYFNGGNVGININTPSEILDVNGNARIRGTVLPETNNVQTIQNVNSATIQNDKNVVVVENTSSNDCTLTISTSTNIASIKVINIGSKNVSFSAGTGVTISKNILDGTVLPPDFSGTLTKIATNDWIVSQ